MWRLLDHGPGLPRWNMAVDKALWRSHAETGGPPTLRFYQWSRPTLSLGAGQRLPARLSLDRLQSLGVAVVRRPTGGRAVLHGGDLTYALVAGAREGFPPSVTSVYRRLCRALQAGLARFGLAAAPGAAAPLHPPDFDCFARVAGGDLTWQGKKFLGSAQVWQGPSFLQHGAILLTPQDDLWRQLLDTPDQGTAAPVISLSEILGSAPSLSALKHALVQGFQEELGLSFAPGDLSAWEEQILSVEIANSAPVVENRHKKYEYHG